MPETRIDFALGQIDGVRVTKFEFESSEEGGRIKISYEYDGVHTIFITPETAKDLGLINLDTLSKIIKTGK